MTIRCACTIIQYCRNVTGSRCHIIILAIPKWEDIEPIRVYKRNNTFITVYLCFNESVCVSFTMTRINVNTKFMSIEHE